MSADPKPLLRNIIDKFPYLLKARSVWVGKVNLGRWQVTEVDFTNPTQTFCNFQVRIGSLRLPDTSVELRNVFTYVKIMCLDRQCISNVRFAAVFWILKIKKQIKFSYCEENIVIQRLASNNCFCCSKATTLSEYSYTHSRHHVMSEIYSHVFWSKWTAEIIHFKGRSSVKKSRKLLQNICMMQGDFRIILKFIIETKPPNCEFPDKGSCGNIELSLGEAAVFSVLFWGWIHKNENLGKYTGRL